MASQGDQPPINVDAILARVDPIESERSHREYLQWRDRVRREEDDRRAREPTAAKVLADIRATADRVILKMASLPCGGERERIAAHCTSEVVRTCPERGKPCCPREIVRHESSIGYKEYDNFGRLEKMGIPSVIAGPLARGDEVQTPALVVVKRWMAGDYNKRTLCLVGPGDSGKSHAAAFACDNSTGALFLGMSALQTLVQQRKASEWAEFLRRLRFWELVVLDDLGAEPMDLFDQMKSAVAAIITTRIEGDRRTILTLNDIKILGRYGERVTDRVAKLSHVEGVEYVGLRGK